MANVYHFRDLSPAMREVLLQYIDSRFSIRSTINHRVSAYSLKQRFTRLAVSPEEHVTTQCFKEAMEVSGFRSVLRGAPRGVESNWEFNVHVLKSPQD